MNLLSELGRGAMDQPWALEPGMEAAASMIWALRMINDSAVEDSLAAIALKGLVSKLPVLESADARQSKSGIANAPDNFAVVPVRGVLVQSANFMQRFAGASSYQKIRDNLAQAMASDASVVLLDVSSPGGDVVGCEETANAVYDARAKTSADGGKKIVAFCQSQACSAAWWIASQADEVITTLDARVGSIGVIAKITDTSRKEKNQGADTTILTTGPNKAIGAGPLTDSQQQVLRELMQEAFDSFVAAVERGRSKANGQMQLTDDMKSGRIYTGKMGKANGLVDENMTMAQLFSKYGA